MEEFSVTIKPLTPIWTGDANGKNSTLRETGIIGSLRWWYEALIRGLGGYACDPTDESLRCKLEHDKFNMALKSGKTMSEALNDQICQACQLFGCTGWSRKFKLEIETLEKSYAPFVIEEIPNARFPYFLGYYDTSEKAKEYVNNGGLMGKYKLRFIIEDANKVDLLKNLFTLASSWGIGAGVQKGFGVVDVEEKLELSNTIFPQQAESEYIAPYTVPLPRLDQFFFYKIPINPNFINQILKLIGSSSYKSIKDLKDNEPLGEEVFSSYPYLPTSPWVRNKIRSLIRDKFKNNQVLRHLLMGFISNKNIKPIHKDCWEHSIAKDKKDGEKYYCEVCKKGNITKDQIIEKTGSKIFVSHIYNKNAYKNNQEPKWEMRIWGWLPEIPKKINVSRKEIKQLLQVKFKDEDFWKQTFDFIENPVLIESIQEKWDLDPTLLINNRGVFYE